MIIDTGRGLTVLRDESATTSMCGSSDEMERESQPLEALSVMVAGVSVEHVESMPSLASPAER
jgi:hypothetical protein